MRTKGLQLNFGATPILQGVDINVMPGDLYGLLGRNGAGKTTTMRALLGFLPQARGLCEVFGVPSNEIHKVAEPLGVALDPPGLDDSLSVRQNLELARIRGNIQSGRTVDEVLELVGLTHRQHNRGDKLSHGQGRRAAVARALLGSPQLLVLDEPLSGLDPEGVEQLLELFSKLAFDEGITVVLSSHHLREVQDVCNRIGVIEQGRCVLEGETAKLLAAAGEHVEVHCHDAKKAISVFEQLPKVDSVLLIANGKLKVRIKEGVDLSQLCSAMVNADVGLKAFIPQHASLMDLFQQTVGGEQ